MTIGIIDDELDNQEILHHFISQYTEPVRIIGYANNVKTGLKLIHDCIPDVIFLDIDMPDGSGFDLVGKLHNHKPEIVFCTAYNQFALKAIECSALAYILKPITEENVFNALKKANLKVNDNNRLLQYKILNEQVKETATERFIVTNSDGMHVLFYNQVLYCIAHSNYTDIYLADNHRITISKTLKDVEFMLSKHPNFIRIHHSNIINMDYVIKLTKTESNISATMIDGIELSVSRSKKEKILFQFSQKQGKIY